MAEPHSVTKAVTQGEHHPTMPHPVTPVSRIRRSDADYQSPLVKRLHISETIEEEHQRIAELVRVAAERAPPSIVSAIQQLSPHVAWIMVAVKRLLPVYARGYKQAFEFISKLPTDLLRSLYGFSLCFFGGTYVTSLACISAFKMCGWDSTRRCLKELHEEYKLVERRSLEDDMADADNDGIADVNQISTGALIQRKINLALATANPDKIRRASEGLYTACLAVLATVQIKFARTVAIGASVAKTLRTSVGHYLVPVLVHLLEPQHHQWIETIVDWGCKFVSVTFAWYLQRTISAVHSATEGGLLFSRGLMAYAFRKGLIDFGEEDTHADEILGFTTAAVGVLFQLRYRFSVPFPLNIPLLPLSIAEGAISWAISK